LHANEVVLAIHGAMGAQAPYIPTTRFEPMPPMPWARGE
jgi:hypothetical protein